MALNDDDVREILRIIDESELDELRIETGELSLHVVRGGAVPPAAPAPGEAPFVDLGSAVEPDTIVGIIEVMKMMNSVHAGLAGTIAEVCVENGEPVEYGAPLFRVET